jgi:PIN domain nuclease of toxin-antitoxin system
MLLDTCALLWLAHDQTKLSKETLEMIDTAPVVFISALTGFEIALKHRAGKLQLPSPPQQWLSEILMHHRIDVIGLDLGTCIKAAQLPPLHKDPVDRFIVAAALTLELPVVTADQRFAQYGVRVLL